MDETRLKQEIQRLLERERERNSYAKSADVAKLFKTLAAAVQKVHPTLSKEIDSKFRTKLDRIESTERKLTSLVSEARNLRDSEIQKFSKEIRRELANLRNDFKEVPTVDDVIGFFDSVAENLPKLSPIEIRDSLESIKDEEEKLDINAVKNLREELDELRKFKAKTVATGGGITGRDIIKSYDLSPFLDGSTKTFAIPGNWTVLSVSGTSFPFTYRRLVDYTFTPQEITFTSEITAETSLAAGQTIEILYVSA